MSPFGGPVVLVRAFCSRFGVLLVTVLSLGCGGGSTGVDPMLPPEFQVRSDVPYMRGVIVERIESARGGLRIRVRAVPGVETRNAEVIATVLPDAVIRWADGSHATRDQLRRGQGITVWVTGPELRSLPPQVGANGLILHRRFWR
jgi:hypothetical protein